MLEFFRMAEQSRVPKYRDIPLHKLMRAAAEQAGWHLEYVPNLQNRNKYQVRYTKPFSSAVTAELACRMRPAIMAFLAKRDIDPKTIDSFVGYGFFNFIKTYKPEVHDTDEKIKAAIYRSVMNKVDQGNRKEIFRYRPTNLIDEETGEPIEKKKHKYSNTPREVSINTTVYGKDGDESAELQDFIPDDRTGSPLDTLIEEEEIEELVDSLTNKSTEKILLRILIEAGGSGERMKLKSLIEEALENSSIRDQAIEEITIQIKREQKASGSVEEIHITKEMVEKRVEKDIKIFYRNLKHKLGK